MGEVRRAAVDDGPGIAATAAVVVAGLSILSRTRAAPASVGFVVFKGGFGDG